MSRMVRFPVGSRGLCGKLEEWGGRQAEEEIHHMENCLLVTHMMKVTIKASNKRVLLRAGRVIQWFGPIN